MRLNQNFNVLLQPPSTISSTRHIIFVKQYQINVDHAKQDYQVLSGEQTGDLPDVADIYRLGNRFSTI